MSTVTGSRVAVLIPARLASTRLPKKVLASIHGKSMLQWVYDAATEAEGVDSVSVVSGDVEIRQHCVESGMQCLASQVEHLSGTDRIAEVVEECPQTHFINLQADEPTINPDVIAGLARAVVQDDADLVTVGHPVFSIADLENRHRVKIEVDRCGRAVNFSRHWTPMNMQADPWIHVGLYGFRRRRLLDFARLPHTTRSINESLEQLRALEAGWTIGVVGTPWQSLGVDTQDDLQRARTRMTQFESVE